MLMVKVFLGTIKKHGGGNEVHKTKTQGVCFLLVILFWYDSLISICVQYTLPTLSRRDHKRKGKGEKD